MSFSPPNDLVSDGMAATGASSQEIILFLKGVKTALDLFRQARKSGDAAIDALEKTLERACSGSSFSGGE